MTGRTSTSATSADVPARPRLLVGRGFESVALAQRLAQRTLPRSVYRSLLAGSERSATVADNSAAYHELGLAPVVLGQTARPSLATTVMDQSLSMPVLISPTGSQAVHPDAEVAIARAAAARGTANGLSMFASKPIEDVIAANAKTFFQLYWIGDREAQLARLERARQAGVVGLIVTTDWSFSLSREWGTPPIPRRIDLPLIARRLPEALLRPRWLTRWALAGGRPPELRVPNVGPRGGVAPPYLDAYVEWAKTPPPTWDDLAWLREQWTGPLMLKGVMRVEDARRAVDAGVDAISVSNHGGNNLDGSPAAVRMLPAIAAAVGDQIEVLTDGGIRRGSDVVKALALGARAVMIGRPALWGLAVDGESGVANVLDILRRGMTSTLRGMGKASIAELAPRDLYIAASFPPAPPVALEPRICASTHEDPS